MKASMTAFVSALWIAVIVGPAGCQNVKVPQQQSHAAPPSFMETWNIYTHCISTESLEPLMVDTLLLKRATNEMQQDETLRLFSPLKSFMSPSPVRLAADPRAMTASCTLKTAETAAENGWNDLAMTLYQSIIKDYSEPAYGYYRDQANAGVGHIRQHMANLPAAP
jgi:hypothetical protein